jgi:hypothetical protein
MPDLWRKRIEPEVTLLHIGIVALVAVLLEVGGHSRIKRSVQ